ncbi:unnamed protein product [Debaryomyces tyrocola]|nr:unnamed protein product [Debaryomyces tyrocola]
MMIFRASEHNTDSYLSHRIVFDKMP